MDELPDPDPYPIYLGYENSGVTQIGVTPHDMAIWTYSYVLYNGRSPREERSPHRCRGPIPGWLRQGVLETLAAVERGEYPLGYPGLWEYVACLDSGYSPREASALARAKIESRRLWEERVRLGIPRPPESPYKALVAQYLADDPPPTPAPAEFH